MVDVSLLSPSRAGAGAENYCFFCVASASAQCHFACDLSQMEKLSPGLSGPLFPGNCFGPHILAKIRIENSPPEFTLLSHTLKTCSSLHTLNYTGTQIFSPILYYFLPQALPLLLTCWLKLRWTNHTHICPSPLPQKPSLLFTCWLSKDVKFAS